VTATGPPQVDTATVLFTDTVGSTALRARIGEEAADALRLTHDDLVRNAIEGQRGNIVKHTGDGVMATFSAAVDAVAAAIAIQQSIDNHNRRGATERIEVRVGISVGDVSFDADDCFGLPVVEAQRLEAAAEPGQILCADLVRHLARGRGGHEFASVGELHLKGLPDPIPASTVKWEPVVHVAMPRDMALPPVLAAPAAFDLSGRVAEFDALTNAWKDACAGHRRLVLLSGEPGIGKTRLASELARLARQQGGFVLAGRSDEDVAIPFQPFVEALRFQLGFAGELPSEWLGAHVKELARLVPELGEGDTPTVADAESERARLFEAVTSWLRTTSASVPVLLVLDDMHWADRPTLLLLRHLMHETVTSQLLIVGTYRSTDLDRTHPLAAMLADLRRESDVARVALDGLTADGVAELMERAAGHDLDERGVELANAIHAETAGNPFFVGEIMRHFVESGALYVRDGRWTSDLTLAEAGLPEGIREVVGRRVSHLEDETQRLLSMAAVIGPEFGLPVLAEVAGADEDSVLDGIEHVRSSGLVIETGVDRYRFSHALVRSTLLEELTTTRRVRTHRKVAEAIENLNAANLDHVVAELAYHYGEAAAAGMAEQAVHYARRAGELAVAAAAYEDAVRWFASALEHLEQPEGAIASDLLLRLGQAQWAAGIPEAPESLRAAARKARAGNHWIELAAVLTMSTRTSFDVGQESDPEKIALLEEAIEHFASDPNVQARLMGALAVELIYVGDTTRRLPLLERARELAAAGGDPLVMADVSQSYFNARPRSSWTTEVARKDGFELDETLRAAATLEDKGWLAILSVHRAFYALILSDGKQLRSQAADLAQMSRAMQSSALVRSTLLVEQMIATIDGRLVEARALAQEQFNLWSKVNEAEAIIYRGTENLAIAREEGRLARLLPAWQALLSTSSTAGAIPATVAFMLATTGQVDAAAGMLHERLEGFDTMPDEAGLPLADAMWSEVAVIVGDADAARVLYDRIAPGDEMGMGTGGIYCGTAARFLAGFEELLNRSDEADAHFAAAVADSELLGSPVWVARSLLDWGERVLARGDTKQALELADRADAAIGTLVLPALQAQSAALRARMA